MTHSLRNFIAAAGAALVAAATLPAAASAAPAISGTFDLPGSPNRLTLGPDGNVWATLGGGGDVVKVEPDGTATAYNLDTDPGPGDDISGLEGITPAPDGTLWATTLAGVVKFSPGNPVGTAKEYTGGGLADIATANAITFANGFLFTVSGAKLIKIPPAAPATATSIPIPTTGARGIAVDAGGQLWIADFNGAQIVSVKTDGTGAKPYPVGGDAQEVVTGPGTQIAYTAQGPDVVGRLTPGATTPQTTSLPATVPVGITFANDGNYWAAQFNVNAVVRVTPAGAATPFPIAGLPIDYHPRYITNGAGNTLWVGIEKAGDANFGKIVRISNVDPPPGGGGGGGGGTDVTKPVISKPAVTPRSRRAGQARRIRFTLSEAATVTLRFQRARAGKRKGRACVKPTRALRRAKTCVRYRTVRTRRAAGTAGANRLAFNAKFGKAKLPAGRYRVTLSAKDAAGNVSALRSATFKVLTSRAR
ncbi:MAG: hypothetical protein U0R70_10575 [Solirubrobacteraceae bacterium]